MTTEYKHLVKTACPITALQSKRKIGTVSRTHPHSIIKTRYCDVIMWFCNPFVTKYLVAKNNFNNGFGGNVPVA